MTDIVERLREEWEYDPRIVMKIRNEAADIIERHRAAVEPSDANVERLARVQAEIRDWSWGELDQEIKGRFRKDARAILTAIGKVDS